MLQVEGIHTFYGSSHILFGVSLTVSRGEIVCLLGRNGAGKSTTMKSIIGLTPPRQGVIKFKSEDIARAKPYIIARMGIGFVPDDRRVFFDLTVDENLEISERKIAGTDAWNRERVYEFFQPLKHIRSRKAGFLSGGEQQMLTIARALVTNPELLLLDEPTEGLAPIIVDMLEQRILALRDAGLTILLAEQNQKTALGLSDRGYILDNGVIKYHGTIKELQENEEIIRKYLLV
ncbi:MAG: ABC transporter ATP-binding protein [Deltaproteobacteria bacterium]|nr:ABC transporter ATP-binding protein [Deltaproteobacteria bacterium]